MISQSRTPAGILRTLTAILCLAAILMSVTGSSAWAAPRVVRVVGIQDGISDSQADYFRRTIAELNDLTEDRIFVTRPIPAASSLDLNAYQGLDFAIVSPRVFALLERYNGFIPMASLSVDIPDCEPGAELRPVVSALVFATPDADEDGLAKPHLSDIAGETVTVVKGDEVDTTFLLQNELSSRRLAPVKVRVASDGGTPSEIIRRAVERGDKLFAVSTDLLRETSSDLFSGFVKVDMRVDDETGLVSSVTPMPGRVFAAGLSVARMGLLEFAATLFALDIAPDIRWVRPADYRSVHLAAERMRDPAYMSYQKKTLLEEMREHAAWVILAAAILIGMIWHSVAAERLVRRRSAELMETVKRQQASERQFEALERMTAVSQMSNIVAHELRQPLAAVTNFAMGVRRRIANGTLTADSLEFALGRILAENERASDIVEHVRDYARKRRQITPVDLTQMSAEAFLEEDDLTVPGCGVFDVRMTGITGMELHQKLIELANRLPVIFVSAHGDIEMAVKAMRRGAVDFLTKPVVDEKLLSSIDRAVARSCEEAAEAETVRELAGLWQALSPRECQVAQLAAEGLTTKAVSDVLGIAERTAQVHIAHVCSKLGVENAVGVAQIIARLRARGVLQ